MFLQVADVDGGYRRLRQDVLRPPFQPVAFVPHVTLAHPRTSRRRADLPGAAPAPAAFTVREVTVTAFDGARWMVVARFPLGGAPAR